MADSYGNFLKRRALAFLDIAKINCEKGYYDLVLFHIIGKNDTVRVLAEFIGGCGAGRIYTGLQPDGTVVPCVFLPIPVGNIRTKGFSYV